jgi:hypothetical protein
VVLRLATLATSFGQGYPPSPRVVAVVRRVVRGAQLWKFSERVAKDLEVLEAVQLMLATSPTVC